MSYPSFRYHASKEPVIVKSAEEEEKLGKGWADSPAAFDVKPGPKSDKKPSNSK